MNNPIIKYYSNGSIYYKEYRKDNKLHNEEGPARTVYFPNGKKSM